MSLSLYLGAPLLPASRRHRRPGPPLRDFDCRPHHLHFLAAPFLVGLPQFLVVFSPSPLPPPPTTTSSTAASPSPASPPPNLHPISGQTPSALTPSRYLHLRGVALTDVRLRGHYGHEHGSLSARSVPSVHYNFSRVAVFRGCSYRRRRSAGGTGRGGACLTLKARCLSLACSTSRSEGIRGRSIARQGDGGKGRAQCGADTEGGEEGGGGAASGFVPRFSNSQMPSTAAEDTSTTYSKPEFTLVLSFIVSHDLSLQLVRIAFWLALTSRARAQTRRKRHGLMPPHPRVSFFAHSCIGMGIIGVSLRLCTSTS
ncbi:hypothetical protein C8R45DRAFT_1107047 [Mycena sanguinolenta]|nr:hypothetical protein C8R45DRAFT_1107047 [Mycena sanguinolenta]